MKRLVKIFPGLVLLAAGYLQGGLAYAASANMYLSPGSTSVVQGGLLVVAVREDSGDDAVQAVQANLSYPTDLLTFSRISSSAAFDVSSQSSGGSGLVQIGRGTTAGVSGNQLVATVYFTAKTSSGTASISFASGSKVASNGSDITGGLSGGNYTLKPAPAVAPPPPPDTTPPTITKVASTSITTNSAIITWTTSEPSSSEVDYGPNQSYGLTAVDPNPVTDHKVTLNSPLIAPGTSYHYLVKSADPSSNIASSKDGTFTTKGASLIITVLNQKTSKPIQGVKVSLNEKTGTTNKNGQVTLTDLPLGKLTGTATYKGKQSVLGVQIKSIDPAGKPQAVTLKIQVPSNVLLVILIPVVLLLLVIAWFIGLEEGQGKLPRLRLRNEIKTLLPTRSAKKGALIEPIAGLPSSTKQAEPTIIRPGDGPPKNTG